MINDRDIRRAARVITKLRLRFPTSYSFLNDDPAMMVLMSEEWAADFEGLSDDDLIRGLDFVKRSGATFPPSVPQFISYCKTKQCQSHQISLPAPTFQKGDTAVAKNALAEMRSTITGMIRH